jgi:branched-chain amino acid transport system ATP-binding protein
VIGAPVLEVEGLRAGYGQVAVLHGLDLVVNEGEIVVLLGANGAGKTTTLRALCGMVDAKGSVLFEGKQLVGRPTEWIVRQRIAHVPQGRGTFPELTVEENLEAGAYCRNDRAGIRADMDRWFDAFPRLAERRSQQAGSLSGGEQQMLAVARALMLRPKLLLLDEPSLGLAPIITQGLFTNLAQLNAEDGTTMFVVEQNANLALSIAARAYVLEAGEIVLSGSSDELRLDDDVRKAYLGF